MEINIKIKIEIKMLLFLTFLFMTREEVPRSTVTKMMELVRRQTAQQVELGVLEELWGKGINFCCEVHLGGHANFTLRGGG